MIVKHGKSIEITDQLSSESANVIAQWIGSYTVIYNQKTIQSKADFAAWIAAGKPEDQRPTTNAKAAHFSQELPFLKNVPSQIRRNAGAKWFEALSAAKKGVRKHPQVKPRHKKRNCYVTNELFDVQALDENRCIIQLRANSTKKSRGQFLTGIVMPFAKEDAGKALYLSRKGARFWLSMAYDKSLDVMTASEAKTYALSLTDEELSASMIGYDLGVKRQVTGSDGAIYHLNNQAQEKLKALDARRKRYQKRYARMALANDKTAGTKKRQRSNAEKKLQNKIARYSEKKAAIQMNNSHHISKKIADDTPLIAVFEDIKINNMVRKPKAKLCEETGRWLQNGAAAKRGLNLVIHSANMGQIRQFSAYKLRDRGKLFIKVKPHHSSQECSKCGHIDKDNRKTQEKFECLNCGFAANADDNASEVIKGRGQKHVRSEAFSKEKTVRKISARRNKARELASSGSGDVVSLENFQAAIDDALNSKSTFSNDGLLEARRL